jgi:hypothetical protein
MSESLLSREARLMVRVFIVTLAMVLMLLAAQSFLAGDSPLRLEFRKAALTVFAGGFVGGLLKILLDDVVAARRRWDDTATFVTNVLADLKAAYDRVERARVLIPAHQSAKVYGDEMCALIDARVTLLNVVRALKRRADGLAEPVRGALERDVRRMERFIERLTAEFRENYARISTAQAAYEAAVKRSLDRTEPAAPRPPAVPNEPWQLVCDLRHARKFIDPNEPTYGACFVAPLDHASLVLREELARVLRRKQPSARSLATARHLDVQDVHDVPGAAGDGRAT